MSTPRGNRREKLTPELAETVRQRWIGGQTYVQIRAWLQAEHGIVASDACLSRACHRAGVEAGEVLYKTEQTVTLVERMTGPDVDDDAVTAVYRNELLKQLMAAKKEAEEGKISKQEFRGMLIQFSRANNDTVRTRKLLRAPDRPPQGVQTGQNGPQCAGAEVVFESN